ncbi:hypothetical protein AQB9606_03957 [Aquabacterium sp. CECT 9606]|nr:hypothetical protein AQB9606_03957 [Aquabacterium sp. CECT 9606]
MRSFWTKDSPTQKDYRWCLSTSLSWVMTAYTKPKCMSQSWSPAVDASRLFFCQRGFLWSSGVARFSRHRFNRLRGHNLVAWPVQSGCLPFGRLLTKVRRQSATRHRLVAVRPAAASAPWCRGKPQHMASRSHGQRPSLPGVFQRNVEASNHLDPLHSNKVAAQWSAVNSGGGYAVCNQIHGAGKRAQTLFHFAPQPNCSVNPTPTSYACGYPPCYALRCGLPRALGF